MSLDIYLSIDDETVFDQNITHNLGKMADAAGLYYPIWRPEEVGISKASQLIEPLRAGLAQMCERPSHFEQFNASNGWGLYEHFLPWLARLLEACITHPDAAIRVSR